MIFDAIKCAFDVLPRMLKNLNMNISWIGKILCKVGDYICIIWLKIYYGVHKVTHYLGMWIYIHDNLHSWNIWKVMHILSSSQLHGCTK